MSIEKSFNSDCENIFHRNKFLLERKIDISDKTKELDLENFYDFNEMFESHQKDLANKLIEYLELYKNPNLQQELEPIAKFYIVEFLNLVHIPKFE